MSPKSRHAALLGLSHSSVHSVPATKRRYVDRPPFRLFDCRPPLLRRDRAEEELVAPIARPIEGERRFAPAGLLGPTDHSNESSAHRLWFQFVRRGRRSDQAKWVEEGQGRCKRRLKKQLPPLRGSRSRYQLTLRCHSQPELPVQVKLSDLLRSLAIQTEEDRVICRSVVVRPHECKLHLPQKRFESWRPSQRTL